MNKNDMRTLSASAQETLRLRVVKAVKEGMGPTEASRVFGVSRQALHNWLQAYAKGGESALKSRKRGRPIGGGRLQPWQTAQVVEAVIHRYPEQLDTPGFLWARNMVREYIEQQFGVQYTARHVGRLLKRWGFTPQKTVCVPLSAEQTGK